MLGSLPTNNHNIEVQLMNRFCRDIYVMNIEKPANLFEEFSLLFTKMDHWKIQKGTLKDINISGFLESAIFSSRYAPNKYFCKENYV